MDSQYREPGYTEAPDGDRSHWTTRHLLLAACCLALLIAVIAVVAWMQPAGRYPIAMNGRFGYIDHSGKVVVPVQFADAGHFDAGLAPVKVGRVWGYTDKSGKLAIAPTFDVADPFSGGMALV